MSKSLLKDNKGFTIIEVLIVLAIAGLIMLIVFLAVPALQRNNRNTQRRNDVSNVLGSVAEFASNNNGNLPAVANLSAVVDSAATGYYKGTGTGQGNVDLVLWATGNNTALCGTSPSCTGNAAVANDRIQIITGAKCAASGASEQGSARQVVVKFLVETSSGYAAQCQQS